MSGSNSLFDPQTPIADQIASNPVGTSMLWGVDPTTLKPYQVAAPAQTVNAKNLLNMPMANVAMGFGDSPGTMAGVGAKTADLSALRAAQKMAASGVDSDAIWKNTGWGQGADGKWRFEIPDNNAQLGGKDFTPGDQLTLGHVMDHPELFAAYPDLANMPVHGMPQDLVAQGYRGAYDPQAGAMWVTGGRSPSETLSTVLHENQHAVQTREGFQNGGNLNESTLKAVDNLPVYRDQVAGMDTQMRQAGLDPQLIRQALAMGDGAAGEAMRQLGTLGNNFATTYRETLSRLGDATKASEFYRTNYSNMAGEVEARNTQSRQGLTAAQRRQMPPDWTQDVPTEQQVVVQGNDGAKYSVKPVDGTPPGLGPKSPFEPAPINNRAAPTDNYLKSLNTYAPTLYREMAPGEALNHLGGIMGDMTSATPYFADHPSMATGQGQNAGGVMLSYDASKLRGQVNTAKPMWQQAYEGGMGEYIGKHNTQEDYMNAVNGIRIPTNMPSRGYEATLLRNIVGRLEKQGWTKTSGKGYTEYAKP